MTKKKQILQVATKLLALKGYKETSMAELARITGVAQGTIFYHYDTKEALFLAILEEFKSDILNEFEGYLAQRHFNSGLEMMKEVVGFYLYLSGKMEDRFLLLHRHDAYELARVNPVGRDYLESIYNCFVDIFEKAILTGQKDGSIATLPARRTALIIFTMVDGLVRFNTYNLYDAGALYDDLITSIDRILMNDGH
ncbi:MAG: TetR/AcrR family transcriptional regulator [Desulfobacterales bacterium]